MTLIIRPPRVLAVLGGLVAVSVAAAVMITITTSSQDREYRRAVEDAYSRVSHRFQTEIPTGLDEKQAVLAKRPAGITASQEVSRIIHGGAFLGMTEIDLDALRTVDAPPRWRKHHEALLAELEARRTLWSALVDEETFAADFLGLRPTPKRVIELATADEYVSRRATVESAYAMLELRAKDSRDSFPMYGDIWGPDRPSQFRDVRRTHSAAEAVDSAVVCAAVALAKTGATTDTCREQLTYVPRCDQVTGGVAVDPATGLPLVPGASPAAYSDPAATPTAAIAPRAEHAHCRG